VCTPSGHIGAIKCRSVSAAREQLVRECTPSVEKLLAESHVLLLIDQQMFRRTADKILALSNRRLENWVAKAERHYKASLIRAKKDAAQKQSSLLQHYPIFSTTPSALKNSKKKNEQKSIRQPVRSHSITQFFPTQSGSSTHSRALPVNPYHRRNPPPSTSTRNR
jgi:hypothetical protein